MKKKSYLFFLLVAVFLLCCGSLVACGGTSNETGKIVVTYYLYSDTTPMTAVVFDGSFSFDRIPQKDHCVFLGLFDSKTGGTKIVDEYGRCNFVIQSDMTLWAHWQGNNCEISFDAGEGTLPSGSQAVSLIYGSVVPNFPVPERVGYTFVGWANKENLVSDGATPKNATFDDSGYTFEPNSDTVILVAKYEVKQFTLTLDYNDSSYRTDTRTVHYGDALDSVNLPKEDTGKSEIVGWSTERNRNIPFTGTFSSDVTLYAVWIDYKVFKFYTYDEKYTEHKVYRDDEYEIPDAERAGYRLDGWYDSRTYSGNPVQRVSYGSAATSYYAKWEAIQYHIAFDVDGGDAVLGEITYTIEQDVFLPEAGSKKYCEFVGWCQKEDRSDKPVKILPRGTYGDITLYAKWKGEDRTVILEAGEGTVSKVQNTVEYGANYSLEVPSWAGYEFQGWFTSDNVRMTDKNGNSLSEWTITDQETTLHAEYLKKFYITVNYSHVGAGNVTLKDYYTANEEVNLSVSLNDTGYQVLGFYSADTIVSAGAEYHFIMPEADIVLEVKFKAREFSVILDSDEGYLNDDTFTICYLDEFSLPVPFKQGFIFDGWAYDGRLITDNTGKGLTTWNIKDNITLTATYIVDPDAANKILVYDKTTWLAIANAPHKTYEVVSDIDMSGTSWTPVDFSGVLNGNGFTIRNLSVSSGDGNLGMFLEVSGTIKNLILEKVEIISTSYNNVAVGTICATLSGTIENVKINSGKLTSDIADIGGVVGRITSGSIRNCINHADIDGNKDVNEGNSGGIVGLQTGGTVENCKNYGTIVGKVNTGGIVGGNNNSAATIKNCENYGSVTGRVNTGGIVGKVAHATVLENVTNEGSVNGTDYTAGIAGRFDNLAGNVSFNTNLVNCGDIIGENYVGGITGYIYDYRSMGYGDCDHTVTLTRFTNSGNISGNNYIGGLIGYINVNATHSGSHTSLIKIIGSNLTNVGDVTGVSYVGGLIGYGYSNNTSSALTGCSSSANITAEYYLGGIVGKIENVKITDCSNAGSLINATGYLVEGTNYYAYVGGYAGYGYAFENCNNAEAILYTERGQYVGGIVGYGVGMLTGCTNTASITAVNANHVGGIVGRLNYGNNATLNALTNSGTINGKDYVGGMVGYIYDYRSMGYGDCDNTVTLTRFTNSGNISGNNYIAGLIGYINVYATHDGSHTSVIKITGSNLSNTGEVTGVSYVGGLIGYGYSNNTRSTLTGCTSTATITAEYYLGGIAGKIENVKMIECSNEGSTIIATGYLVEEIAYYAYVGGYVGYGYAFENCSNNVAINYVQRGQYVGGIAGYATGTFTGCFNAASITATNANFVGGIAGRLNYAGDVTLDTLGNDGEITGKDYVGGIAGYIYDFRSMGYGDCNNTVTLTKITNSGKVAGNDYVAGIIGYIYVNATHSGSHTSVIKITGSNLTNTGDITGASYVGGLIGYGYSNNSGSLIVGYESSGVVSGSGSDVGQVVGKIENIILDA